MWSKTVVEDTPRWSKNVLDCSRPSKTVQDRPRPSKTVQDSSRLSKKFFIELTINNKSFICILKNFILTINSNSSHYIFLTGLCHYIEDNWKDRKNLKRTTFHCCFCHQKGSKQRLKSFY